MSQQLSQIAVNSKSSLRDAAFQKMGAFIPVQEQVPAKNKVQVKSHFSKFANAQENIGSDAQSESS